MNIRGVDATRKQTGSYYTCASVADFLAKWAIDKPGVSVLEPSFGDGSFLDAAIERYKAIEDSAPSIYGVELREEPFRRYISGDVPVKGVHSDFMDYAAPEKVDAVIGNPPYVSLKNLPPESRNKVFRLMKGYGVDMPASGSLWMPFVIHATEMLERGGKLGFVLPYEMTYVRYAFRLWEYLKNSYGKLSVYRIHDDFFPDVDVETIIFLAEEKGASTSKVLYRIYQSISGLLNDTCVLSSSIPVSAITSRSKPFESELLSSRCKSVLQKLAGHGLVKPMIETCKFKIGYVCGNKRYFHPDRDTVSAYGISAENLLPCLTNSREISSCRELGMDTSGVKPKNWLFYPVRMKAGERKYISYGEMSGVNEGYKCRARNPWYLTPEIETPDVILTVFGDVPRLVANAGGYVVSNSLLSGILTDRTALREFVCRWYNSLTLLFIELNIHSLGGGSLVLIPGEVDKMPLLCSMPPALTEDVFESLNREIIKKGLAAAYRLGDEIVLKGVYDLSDKDIGEIRNNLETLRSWRKPENRRGRGESTTLPLIPD